MAAIYGEQAVALLSALMRKKDVPDDPGLFGDAGTELETVLRRIRAHVESSKTACTGEVQIRIKLKGYRNANGEVAVDVEGFTAAKSPGPPKRATMVFLDHDGVAHNVAQQAPLPLFDTPRAIDGGAGKAEKKGKAI